MKLAKALKLKNKLTGEIAWLKAMLAKQNVRSVKQEFDYDNRQLLEQLQNKIRELVKVKTAIGTANGEIYDKIFRVAELKGLITTLQELDTRQGGFVERENFGAPMEIEYKAQLSKKEVDQLSEQLKAEVQELQDALEEFNHTRSVEV